MDLIKDYWEQIVFLGLLIWNVSRSQSAISELKKDVEQLQSDNLRYHKWTQRQQEEITRFPTELDVEPIKRPRQALIFGVLEKTSP